MRRRDGEQCLPQTRGCERGAHGGEEDVLCLGRQRRLRSWRQPLWIGQLLLPAPKAPASPQTHRWTLMRTRCFESWTASTKKTRRHQQRPQTARLLGRFGRPSASTRGGCRVDEASGCAQEIREGLERLADSRLAAVCVFAAGGRWHALRALSPLRRRLVWRHRSLGARSAPR